MTTYELPDLKYDYGALEPHLIGEIVELHHDKHHAGYVAGANTAIERLADARAKGEFDAIVGLEKNLAFHVSGHVLHTLYWTNLSPSGGDKPDGALAVAIDDHFGSFDQFRGQLTHVTASVQGSGWGSLAWDSLGERLYIEQVYDHQGNIGQGGIPLLVIDAWEHAYYLQYKNARAPYIDAIWNLIDWADVGARFERASAFDLVI